MRPEKILHKHDSIPTYTSGIDDGCVTCVRNAAIEEYTDYVVSSLKKIQKLILPRDGQQKDVIALLGNWKDHIVAIDDFIKEVEG